jgi:hypothetical protein
MQENRGDQAPQLALQDKLVDLPTIIEEPVVAIE